jgi:DNA-binding PadR family transcriptional regulator
MVAAPHRFSPQTIAVLTVLACDEWRYGLEIAAATRLKSGSLYPILSRLEERGLVEGQWLAPQSPGRPARHAYRLALAGRAILDSIASLSVADGEE